MSNDGMDLSQAYDYLTAQGCTIERIGESDRYLLTIEGHSTVRVSLQEIIRIAKTRKRQELNQ